MLRSIVFTTAWAGLLLSAALWCEAADTRLPTGWRTRPAGRQVALDTFPVVARSSPDGKHVVVLHAGYKPPSLRVYNADFTRVEAEAPVRDAWSGLAFNRNGDRLYVGGGYASAVFEYSFREGRLELRRELRVGSPESKLPRSFIGDVLLSPDEKELYAAELYHDTVAVLSNETGELLRRFRSGRRPYRLLLDPRGQNLLVACFADDRLELRQRQTGRLLASAEVSPGPADIACHGARQTCYVAGSNSNYVDAVRISAGSQMRVTEKINVALRPRWPAGMTPSALSIDGAGNRLYVVCSDANAVAVVDVSGPVARVKGFIPTGWYPTAALSLRGGDFVALNGKGERSSPNPQGPNPMTDRTMLPQLPSRIQYVGLLQTGTASVIPAFGDIELRGYTKTVLAAIPGESVPFGGSPARRYPIRHVIYIMKENRTYDQVLGDLKTGNGDSSLTLFPENVTPNHHKLAREFTLFDSFYVNADVSAEGWFWSSAAIAPHSVMKSWPASYGGRRKTLEASSEEQVAKPPGGYLWTRALRAGLTFRNYGFFVNNRPGARVGSVQLESVHDPELAPHSNPYYAGYDPGFPDIERARIFLRDLAEYEHAGDLPQLITMVLPNDHTFGTAPGKPSPISSMADNDAALGMIVEAVSRSRFWAQTAIFVLEDDAQNGPDHVDSHRSVAYVLSPYVKRRFVDSRFYNTTSMLRTIESLLGLEAMTHYDATASTFFAAFQEKPDLTPYTAEKPRVSLNINNPRRPASELRSGHLDFSQPDRIDDEVMNRILWMALKGGESPPPVRSYFSE